MADVIGKLKLSSMSQGVNSSAKEPIKPASMLTIKSLSLMFWVIKKYKQEIKEQVRSAAKLPCKVLFLKIFSLP